MGLCVPRGCAGDTHVRAGSQEGSRETFFFFFWGGRGCVASFVFTFGEAGRRKNPHVADTNLGSALLMWAGGGEGRGICGYSRDVRGKPQDTS